MSSSITLLGAGSWGTALAVHLAEAGRDVTLWAHRPAAVERMRRTRQNAPYLPEVHIPSSVRLTADLEAATAAADLWGVAVPSQHLRSVAERLRFVLRDDVTIVSLAKGIENDTLLTMSQVLEEVLGTEDPQAHIGVLYGPSHAEEVADGRPTTVVAAAPEETVAEQIQAAFMTERLRVYVNTDVIGVEIGGSAKNVLAIAAGIGDGVGYGDNAKAALITRGIAEIRRLGLAMGAKPQTFAGLAGIGDLIVTCMSQHSRNRYLGEQIGRGKTLEEVLDGMEMVAEGVRTTQSIHDLAETYGVEMPITEAVYAILFDGRRPREMVERLMTRSAKHENWLPDALQESRPKS
ncbi:glycerol-3-phosphate dehydrogenase [Salinibacter sp. 10B]|uniref:NAD(P)H-dependent glycerol-3-phosphate dehydrogenase n=1 Tax=Salinibacter sp. 10B TaxID=1923971 RepID=UPI000CF38816|nr:NAD(P)H-dependent glycerol-3-phosphate dehydrogenase [Salinibacter sp. 10B]PQJ36096.1 glycerol-3-phosphate dehydrogenase [Salinibacter sp. 10B]